MAFAMQHIKGVNILFVQRLVRVAVAVTLLAAGSLRALAASEPGPLNAGYQQMYDLDFDGAHHTFELWEGQHPQDPLGPVSNAAAYLFSEFDRLHILESDLFTDDGKFENRQKPTPDPTVRQAFDAELARAETLADAELARSTQNHDAMFAKIMVDGLRGDYLAMIEKRDLAGLSCMKAGRVIAEKLVAADPAYFDAYLAIGIENYLLGVNPAPVRWFLRLTGAQTNQDYGLRNLRLTAAKGRYLAPYARLLLAVAALRAKDKSTARELLSGLALEFPQNGLYRKELARIQR